MAETNPLPCTLTGQLESFSPLELVNLIHNMRKSGQLDVSLADQHKSIFFQDGEVIFASSRGKQDRLGECLVRSGRLTQKQLDEASRRIKSGVKLGKVLVAEGYLTPSQLWIGVKNQVEEIFYNVLKFTKGNFFFYEGRPELENRVRLSRSVRALILEGVRQMDELKIFVEQVINHSTVFLPLSQPSDLQLTDVEQQLLCLIDGKKTVRHVLSESPSSPFVSLKILSNLMMARVIIPRDLLGGVFPEEKDVQAAVPANPLPSETDLFIKKYNRVFIEIHATLRDVGYLLSQDMQDYFADVQSPFAMLWQSLSWPEEGGIDQKVLVSNLFKVQGDQKSAFLSRALEDLLFYLLFKAQEILPKEIYAALMKSVEELNAE